MARIPSAKPTVRKISARALSYALAGAEQPYPVYQFSDVNKYERPGRNPFAFAATPDVRVTETPTNTRSTDTGDTRIVGDP